MAAEAQVTIVGSVDLVPAFSVAPPGVLVLTRHWDADGDAWLTVKRADPEVTFSYQLLEDFERGGDNDGMYPGVRLDKSTHTCQHHVGGPSGCFAGDVLHIDARDRHLVYRIGGYIPRMESWVARWPD